MTVARSAPVHAAISSRPARDKEPGRSDSPSDRTLLRAAGRGDNGASRILVERYLARLVRFAFRMLGDVGAAEDVVQETFLRLWRNAADWQGEAAIGGWLHRVAYNLCIDHIRKRRPTDDISEMDMPDPADGPYRKRHQQEVTALLSAAMDELPPRQRAAIALVHYQELSQGEAASILEISVDALESLLARGRRALRERLLEHQPDLLGADS